MQWKCKYHYVVKTASGATSLRGYLSKSALWVLGGHQTGGKSKSSPPSDISLVTAFGGKLDFLNIAKNQLRDSSILTAIKFPSLQLRPVMIDGLSIFCNLLQAQPSLSLQRPTGVKFFLPSVS